MSGQLSQKPVPCIRSAQNPYLSYPKSIEERFFGDPSGTSPLLHSVLLVSIVHLLPLRFAELIDLHTLLSALLTI